MLPRRNLSRAPRFEASEKATNRSRFDASIQYIDPDPIHKARMMNIDLPDRAPPRTPPKPPRRPTPCAGLFGWRKGDNDKSGKIPGRDYPLA